MLVQCPNCKTTYKVSDEVLKGAAPAFRCSRCRHTFELETEEPPVAARANDFPAEAGAPPAKEEELSFSFAAKEVAPSQIAKHPPETKPTRIDPSGENPALSDSSADQWVLPTDATSEGTSIDDAAFTDNPELNRPAQTADPAETIEVAIRPVSPSEEAKSERAQNILPLSSYQDQQASIMPFLTLFALIVIGFSLAAVITYAHPKASEELVKKIPLFGSAVTKNTHLKNGILLQSVRGGYQNIQGNREVFVVTGVAINQNPVVIREVQLTGKIRNETGKELEQQTVWVGNTLSAKILRGMTLEDIPHLQSLKPLKSFEMPPGDSVPFAMVFLKANKGIKDFSCAVTFADSEA